MRARAGELLDAIGLVRDVDIAGSVRVSEHREHLDRTIVNSNLGSS